MSSTTFYYQNGTSSTSTNTTLTNTSYTNTSPLVRVDIGTIVTDISTSTFHSCANLQIVTMPDTVTNIGNVCFYNCTSLTSINLSNTLKSIGSGAFNSTKISSIIIPNSVTLIGSYCFQQCSNLINCVLSDAITSLPGYVFSRCSSLTTVTIPNSVTAIGENCFSYCSNLQSCVLSNSAKIIDSYCFFLCSGLQSITIPSSVTNIGTYSFFNNTSLVKIEFNNVNAINRYGFDPFSYCLNLQKVIYYNTSSYAALSALSQSFQRSFPNFFRPGFFQYYAAAGPNLRNFTLPIKFNSDTPFVITPPTSDSTGTFTYQSSNTSVATVSGNTLTIIAPGASIISALQTASSPYDEGSINTTFTVSSTAITNTLTNFIIPIKTFSNAPFIITPPQSNSTGAFTYTSSNTSIATISGNTITITGAGTCNIIATQAGTTTYNSGTITGLLIVTKATPTLSNFSIPSKTTADGPFTLIDPNSNSSGSFSYTSSDLSVATISGNTITIVGVGSSTITATQAVTTNYNSASTTATLKVYSPTTFYYLDGTSSTSSAAILRNTSFTLTSPLIAVNIGTITTNIDYYCFQNCTSLQVVNMPTSVTFIGSFCFNGCTSLNSISLSNNITSLPQSCFRLCSSLTDIMLPNLLRDIGSTVFFGCTKLTSIIIPSLVTTIDTACFQDCKSLLTVVYNNQINITSFGSISTFFYCTALQNVTYYNTASAANLTTTARAYQRRFPNYQNDGFFVYYAGTGPNLRNFSLPSKLSTDSAFTITSPTSDSSGTFTYSSSDTSIATISGNTLTIVGGGSCLITATQEASSPYDGGFIKTLLTINKSTPTLSNFSIPTKTALDARFTITEPTSNSAGTFSYTSSNTSVATVSGNTITIKGVGTTTITASQAETSIYSDGSTTATFTVIKATPTLSNFTMPTKTIADIPFAITAPTSDSTGAFTYTSSDTSVATVSGNMVTIHNWGDCTITATQAETAIYLSATITAPFTVLNKVNPTLSEFVLPLKIYGQVPFTIPPPISNSSGVFTYSTSDSNVATIHENGTDLIIVAPGTCTITAEQAESNNHFAGSITSSFTAIDSTYTNKVPINNLSELIYFLNTHSQHADLQSNIIVSDQITSLYHKRITSETTVQITHT